MVFAVAGSKMGREVTWLSRAIAGVASTAEAISAADRSLSVVISIAPWIKPTAFWLLYGDREAIGRLKEHFLTSFQRRVRSVRSSDHEFRRLLAKLRSSDRPARTLTQCPAVKR